MAILLAKVHVATVIADVTIEATSHLCFNAVLRQMFLVEEESEVMKKGRSRYMKQKQFKKINPI